MTLKLVNDILTYVVGEPMPYPAPPSIAPDSPTIRTNSDFLDIHLYSAQPQQDRVMWQTDQAQLGLFYQGVIPYILVHFSKHRVTFDCPFNIRVVPDDIRESWFVSERTVAGLILASYPTNLFFGIQRIAADWAADLRQLAQLTMSTYPTAEAVEEQQRLIESSVSTAQMWQQRWRKRA